MDESQQELLPIYKSLKKEHAHDLIRTEFDKANRAYSETVRKSIATRDIIRRVESILHGGRPRGRIMTKVAYGMIASESP